MNKKPNAQDYKEEMQNLLNKTEKLQQVVITRLYTLACMHPEAPITTMTDDIIKAKSLIGSNRSKDYIKSLPFETQIKFIAAIEKWLANQHPHQQLEINYDDPICNCIMRDMGTDFDEDGIRYCIHCGYTIK